MIPLYDVNRRKHFPFVTLSIIAACIIIYFVQVLLKEHNAFVFKYSFITSRVAVVSEFYRFFTHMFLHGSFLHLAGNMLFLWIFGDNVEDKFGKIRFIEFYVLGGITAALTQSGISLISGTENIPMIGASGAISAVIGAYLIFFPKAKILTFIPFIVILVPAWLYIIIWFLIQLLSGFVNILNINIAYFAHIGGFVFGIIFSLINRKK